MLLVWSVAIIFSVLKVIESICKINRCKLLLGVSLGHVLKSKYSIYITAATTLCSLQRWDLYTVSQLWTSHMPYQVHPISSQQTVYATQHTIPWFEGIREIAREYLLMPTHQDRNKSIQWHSAMYILITSISVEPHPLWETHTSLWPSPSTWLLILDVRNAFSYSDRLEINAHVWGQPAIYCWLTLGAFGLFINQAKWVFAWSEIS